MSRTFGEVLKAYRKMCGLTVREMAKVINCTTTTYLNYEKNRNGMLLCKWENLPDELKAEYIKLNGFPIEGNKNKKLLKKPLQKKKCLCCKMDFKSTGSENRLCAVCDSKSLSPFESPHNVVRSRR